MIDFLIQLFIRSTSRLAGLMAGWEVDYLPMNR
jgi:hypothetical protein